MKAKKNKGGRPRNAARKKLEDSLGVSGRRVQQIIQEIGLDKITEMSEMRMVEKRVVIALRTLQARREAHELDTAKRLEQGEVIRVEDAIARYAGSLAEIRAQLANVPDRLCAQLNPDNPDAARRILWVELERIGAVVADKIRAL